MFEPTDRIAVAVSGGKDSIALLHILNKIEERFPKAELLAITVDEGISRYRDEAITIAHENCIELRIEHHIVSFQELYGYTLDDIARISEMRDTSLTECTYCGILRRKALNIAARRLGADKLATAHTLDDEIQSFLLNILHGDASRIGAMGPVLKGGEKLAPRVKPYWEVPERESALYAYIHGMRFQTIRCPYRESSMRSSVRRFLNKLEAEHPGIKHMIRSSFERVATALRKQDSARTFKECKICGEPSSEDLCKSCKILAELNLLDRSRG